jgi:hypothetical protein
MMNSQPNIQKCASQGYNNLLVILIIFGVLLSPAYADIAIPTITNVYFEKEGKPHNKPVRFTVNCYGYTWFPGNSVEMEPGTYTPEKVFSFSADCPQYGCEIYENYYLNYRHIDYCDLEGETEGEQFVISNYAASPVNSCEEAYDRPEFMRKCELKFDIPSSPSDIPSSSGVSDNGKDDETSSGCFITTLLHKICFKKVPLNSLNQSF